MILSPEQDFAFAHVPKTGGKSIQCALPGPCFKLWGVTSDDGGHGVYHDVDLAHLNARHARDLMQLNGCPSPFVFGFVRNPWDRAVSAWRYHRAENPNTAAFPQWLREGKTVHQLPQHVFLCDADGGLLVDFVGRYDRLQEDFDAVCDRLKVPRRRLPHIGQDSDGKHYSHYFDRQLKALVQERYRVDIEMFGYAFEDA